MTTFYKGISLNSYEDDKNIVLKDVEIVKQDLLNNIYTSRGERVMMPNYGTSIREILFQPLDAETLALLQQEFTDVFEYDPRVRIISLTVNPIYEEKAVVVIAELRYIEINFNDTMEIRLEFDG